MSLKQKIKDTTVVTDEDKIAILAAVDTYASADIKALEGIIDEFDMVHSKAVSEYKKSVSEVLHDIVIKSSLADQKKLQRAASLVQSGLDELLQ